MGNFRMLNIWQQEIQLVREVYELSEQLANADPAQSNTGVFWKSHWERHSNSKLN
ncbi:MAG TPA: hypothetical protein VMM58_11020 [Bacteroidota bacterium]|nr:hypothetical protein [Bacteroidota bacterium]